MVKLGWSEVNRSSARPAVPAEKLDWRGKVKLRLKEGSHHPHQVPRTSHESNTPVADVKDSALEPQFMCTHNLHCCVCIIINISLQCYYSLYDSYITKPGLRLRLHQPSPEPVSGTRLDRWHSALGQRHLKIFQPLLQYSTCDQLPKSTKAMGAKMEWFGELMECERLGSESVGSKRISLSVD